MFGSDLAQLLGLAANEVGTLIHILIDELLVGGVNEGCQKQDSRSNQSKTPVGNNLGQEIGEESGSGSLDSNLSVQAIAN